MDYQPRSGEEAIAEAIAAAVGPWLGAHTAAVRFLLEEAEARLDKAGDKERRDEARALQEQLEAVAAWGPGALPGVAR